MRGVGFEPTNPYCPGGLARPSTGQGLSSCPWILSPAPLTRLGDPRRPHPKVLVGEVLGFRLVAGDRCVDLLRVSVYASCEVVCVG